MASNEELERRIVALEDEVRQLRRQLGSAPPIEPQRKLGPSNPVRPWEWKPVSYPKDPSPLSFRSEHPVY